MRPKKVLIRFLSMLLAFAMAAAALPAVEVRAAPTTLYAMPGGAASGACDSWASACDLQYALASAAAGTEIWAAQGVYKPGAAGDNHVTFQLKNGVELYGGFTGTETARTARDWQAHVTVLSGDIDSNDTVDPNGIVQDVNNLHGVNACHVVTGSGTDSTAVLDGFTLTAGIAGLSNGSDNCGGAGGGIIITSPGSPTVQNTTITGNWAAGFGGGMYNEGSPAVTHVVFTNNMSPNQGGGLVTLGTVTYTDVRFSGNKADAGGGVSVLGSYNTVTFNGAEFTGNQAVSGCCYTHGGGLYENQGTGGSLVIANARFSGNSATWSGGGVEIFAGNVTLTNVVFSGNYAYYIGGGMAVFQIPPVLKNATFSGNYSNHGGGIWISVNPNFDPLRVANSIFWGNSGPDEPDGPGGYHPTLFNKQIWLDSGILNAAYSDIQQDAGVFAGAGNLNADPQFVSPVAASSTPSTLGDYHLQVSSPAIDAGNNAEAAASTDLDGNPRRMDVGSVADTGSGTAPIVDMGAYETPGLPVANGGSAQKAGAGRTVTLDGAGSTDPVGRLPLTYQWSQTGGPAVQLSSSTAAQPTFTAPPVTVETMLTFDLVVTNSTGQSSLPAAASVTVDPPPIASAGLDQTAGWGMLVNLDGSASSDPYGNLPLTYQWTHTGGTHLPVALQSPGTARTAFTAPLVASAQTLTFTLVVTNALGSSSAPAAVTVTVYPPLFLPFVISLP